MSVMLDHTEIARRYNEALEAAQDQLAKFDLIYLWKYAYERHLQIGEDWNEPFRFPELFGICQRRKNNLIDFVPQMKVRGDGDSSIALNSALDHVKRVSNIERERNSAFDDVVNGGVGWVFVAPVRHEKTLRDGSKKLYYDGLGAERVDPRDILPAASATQVHDHTGGNYCPYLFRRRLFHKDSFERKYPEPMYKNVADMKPTNYSYCLGWRPTTELEQVEKMSGDYYGVLEYWDQDEDIFRIYVNKIDEAHMIYESEEGIPYSHKQLPFHAYYNYKHEESLNGIGEIELNMPYNLFRETILNLIADDVKLSLQPAWIVSGDIQFNTEENELEPGAILTARGLNGGKVGDAMMPFRNGGITADVFQAIATVENSQIAATGDDFRSLFVNPNQLATQTLAKREALLKGVRTNVKLNMHQTEFYLTNQIISYLANELAKPYQDEKGKNKFRKIAINGYAVKQSTQNEKASFARADRMESEFILNPTMAEDFKEYEIETIPSQEDAELKRDQNEKLMMFMQQVMGIVQSNPQLAQQLLGGMDIGEFIKSVSENLGQPIDKIFPKIDSDDEDYDPIAKEHEAIIMGMTPPIRPDEDSYEEFFEHQKFADSKIFKDLAKNNPKIKASMQEHLLLTIQNVQKQKTGNIQSVPTQAAPVSPEGGMGQLQGIPTEQVPG